ncbi:MAG: hypothetical protein ACR2RD_01960 [Woeseiaceae bacterium]
MNKISFLLICVVFLSGCETLPSNNLALADCDTQKTRSCAKNDPQAPTVNINTNASKLRASPYCVKADGGTQMVFRLTPRNGTALGAAEILPKDTSHAWLTGKNDVDRNFIFIDVPEGLDTKINYRYGIKIGSKCTDPRVRVMN